MYKRGSRCVAGGEWRAACEPFMENDYAIADIEDSLPGSVSVDLTKRNISQASVHTREVGVFEADLEVSVVLLIDFKNDG
jgi:hypothetical protein